MPDQMTLPLCARIEINADGERVIREVQLFGELKAQEAAKVLGCAVRSLSNLLDFYDPEQIIQWRWLGHEGQGGKRLFDAHSLERYRAWKNADARTRRTLLKVWASEPRN